MMEMGEYRYTRVPRISGRIRSIRGFSSRFILYAFSDKSGIFVDLNWI